MFSRSKGTRTIKTFNIDVNFDSSAFVQLLTLKSSSGCITCCYGLNLISPPETTATTAEATLQKKHPKYLDLLKIRQPLPAVISILHRVSGALLFFPGIPLVLCSLDMALKSPESYAQFQSFLNNPLIKVGLILSLWLFVHHFFAGIRYLAQDLHYGVKLEQARLSSKAVLGAGIILTLLVGVLIW